jgi:hypothetical protein
MREIEYYAVEKTEFANGLVRGEFCGVDAVEEGDFCVAE